MPPVSAPSPTRAITWCFSPENPWPGPDPGRLKWPWKHAPFQIRHRDFRFAWESRTARRRNATCETRIPAGKELVHIALMPHVNTILSRGTSNTRCSASVNSTTPRLEAKCPPRCATVSIISRRISVASSVKSACESSFKSCGPFSSSKCTHGRPLPPACRSAFSLAFVKKNCQPLSNQRQGKTYARIGCQHQAHTHHHTHHKQRNV